tara:strand:- start:320 stop:526 length:207 start_codon:yes stop_codon:yes gene_type:complete
MNQPLYMKLDDLPVRLTKQGEHTQAEIYMPGSGFTAGDLLEIMHSGVPITRQEFDSLLLAARRPVASL